MTPLSDDMTRVLNELLEIRNWTFHNPQSRMVAAKEIAEKNNIVNPNKIQVGQILRLG